MTNSVTATVVSPGVWKFVCRAHTPEQIARGISAPKQAMQVMMRHVDDTHPGERFTLYAYPRGSVKRKTYTGKKNGEVGAAAEGTAGGEGQEEPAESDS